MTYARTGLLTSAFAALLCLGGLLAPAGASAADGDEPPSARTVRDAVGDSVARDGIFGEVSAEELRSQDITAARITIGEDRVLLTTWVVGPLDRNALTVWYLTYRDSTGEVAHHRFDASRDGSVVQAYSDAGPSNCFGTRRQTTRHRLSVSLPKSCMDLADGRWLKGHVELTQGVIDSGGAWPYDRTRSTGWIK